MPVCAAFTESIPDSVFKLKNLRSAPSAKLNGRIPNFSGQSSFIIFDTSHNLLTGNFPALAQAKNLTSIFINDNQLTGTLPDSISGLQNLVIFEIYANNFYGEIPASYATLPKDGGGSLKHFAFDRNYLIGSVPDIFYRLDVRTYGNNCFSKFLTDQVKPQNPAEGKNATQRSIKECMDFYSANVSTSTTTTLSITAGTTTSLPTLPTDLVQFVTVTEGRTLTAPMITSFVTLTRPDGSVETSTVVMPRPDASNSASSDGSRSANSNVDNVMVPLIAFFTVVVIGLMAFGAVWIVLNDIRKRRAAAPADTGIVANEPASGRQVTIVTHATSTEDIADGDRHAQTGSREDDASRNVTRVFMSPIGALQVISVPFSNSDSTEIGEETRNRKPSKSSSKDSLDLTASQDRLAKLRSSLEDFAVDIASFTSAQVSEWLESMDVGPRICRMLLENGVTGEELLFHAEERLDEVGIHGPGRESLLLVVDAVRGLIGGVPLHRK
ncbi:hypothetical protein HDU97_006767 [Phlyctochytrium planicorne]|nr:hypothetical protein HDU97_006767 [Phlyctochytrium planicorne]